MWKNGEKIESLNGRLSGELIQIKIKKIVKLVAFYLFYPDRPVLKL